MDWLKKTLTTRLQKKWYSLVFVIEWVTLREIHAHLVPEAEKLQIKVVAHSVSRDASFPGSFSFSWMFLLFPHTAFPVCVHSERRGEETEGGRRGEERRREEGRGEKVA